MNRKGGAKGWGATCSFMKSVLVGMGAGIILWGIMLVAAGLFLTKTSEPEAFVSPVAIILVAMTAFFAGFVAQRLSGQKNVWAGVLSGVMLFVMVWVLSYIPIRAESETSALVKLILGLNFLFFSFLGGAVGRPSGRIKRKKVR